MRIQCPSCSGMVDVPDESAGRVMNCPACAAPMQVPEAAMLAAAEAAPPAPPPGPAPAGDTRKCPFCGETILKVARKCKHCKEDIPEGVDAESVRARLAAKDRKAAEQLASGARPAFRWPVFRTLTLILAGTFLVILLLTILAFSSMGDDGVPLGVVGVIALIILGIGLLVTFINDMQMLFYSRRNSPDKALKAFLHAIRTGRYACAYACVLDGDKDGLERRRRAIPSVSVTEGRFSLATLDGFRAYWKELARPTGLHMRRAILSGFAVETSSGEYAQVKASVKIEAYPWPLLLFLPLALLPVAIIISVITKREQSSIVKLLRRVGDRWYLVNGELESPEDRALDMAVALSAASPDSGKN